MGIEHITKFNTGLETWENKYDYTAREFYIWYQFVNLEGKRFVYRGDDLEECRKKRYEWEKENE